MTTKKIIALGLLAAAGWMFYSNYQKKQKQAEIEAYNKRYSNQLPPSQTPEWYHYISLIIELYGQAASLWEPGGPFYKTSVPDPRKDPSGWAKVFTQTRF